MWIDQVIRDHGFEVESLSYVFCTDTYLLKINQDYLNHNTLTDIVTFDLTDHDVPHGTFSKRVIEGEIYISIPRVRDNARKLGTDFTDELDRVIIHGVLHLLGFKDKTPADKSTMRKKEEACLSLRKPNRKG